jgi:hypothetical protein
MSGGTDATSGSLWHDIVGDGTPKKAFLTALLIGTVLTAINHGDMLLVGDPPSIWKVVLTFLTPYVVTTWGAVTGKRAQLSRQRKNTS